MCDFSLEIEVGHFVGVGFVRYFVMRGLEMQLCLFRYALAYWLVIICVVRIMYRRGVPPWNQDCSLSLSMPGVKRKISCTIRKGEIVRKGEKQIQILDGY
jgi:hypothetical protein